jgi:hypothetical protein
MRITISRRYCGRVPEHEIYDNMKTAEDKIMIRSLHRCELLEDAKEIYVQSA